MEDIPHAAGADEVIIGGADGQLRCDWQCDPRDEPAKIRSR